MKITIFIKVILATIKNPLENDTGNEKSSIEDNINIQEYINLKNQKNLEKEFIIKKISEIKNTKSLLMDLNNDNEVANLINFSNRIRKQFKKSNFRFKSKYYNDLKEFLRNAKREKEDNEIFNDIKVRKWLRQKRKQKKLENKLKNIVKDIADLEKYISDYEKKDELINDE